MSELTLGENTTVAHHHVYKSRYLNALREADEGELLVRIPEGCIQQVRRHIIKGSMHWQINDNEKGGGMRKVGHGIE